MSENDPRSDIFRPPSPSTLAGCLHCQQTYESYLIEWRVERCHDGVERGFWCCPVPGCDGRGFGFDIFPVDPDWRDEHGERIWFETDEEATCSTTSLPPRASRTSSGPAG